MKYLHAEITLKELEAPPNEHPKSNDSRWSHTYNKRLGCIIETEQTEEELTKTLLFAVTHVIDRDFPLVDRHS